MGGVSVSRAELAREEARLEHGRVLAESKRRCIAGDGRLHDHVNDVLRVARHVVGDRLDQRQRAPRLDLEAQLFEKLAVQRVGKRFAELDAAARQQPVGALETSLSYEEQSLLGEEAAQRRAR